MNQVFNIAKMTVLMSLRRGTLPAILIVVVVMSTLIFNVARSDGDLINELDIRLLYSYGFTYSALSLIAISIACFTVRSQLDAKNIHMLTSYPVSRKVIFFGQGLGVALILLLSELVLLVSIVANAWLYSQEASQESQDLAANKYLNSRKLVYPNYKSKRDLTLEFAKEYDLKVEKLNEILWDDLAEQAIFKDQNIKANESKIWFFDTGGISEQAEEIVVKFNFRQGDRLQKIKGALELNGVNSPTYFKANVEAHQFQEYKIKIPFASVPEDGIFTLTFTNLGTYSTVVTRSGLTLEFVDGNFYGNFFKVILSQFIHAFVMIVVGMCAGLGLSFSVANFLVMMLYLMSVAEGVVSVVIEEMGFKAVVSMWDTLVVNLLKAAIWVTKGLQPPDVIGKVCSGVSVDSSYIFYEWLPATSIYGLIALLIALKVFDNKELDRLQV